MCKLSIPHRHDDHSGDQGARFVIRRSARTEKRNRVARANRATTVKETGNIWGKVQLYDIDKMDEPKRKRLAAWLRDQARTLLKEHGQLSKTYRARYWK